MPDRAHVVVDLADGKRSLLSGPRRWLTATPWPLILACVIFQIHWLQPIQPLVLKYAKEHGHISEDTTTNTIFPFFTYSLIPCTLLVGAIFQLFGSVPALLVASIADLGCVLLVTQATSADYVPFIFAEILFGISFTSLFTVSACLASGIPGSEYQRASSLNRSAFLLAAISSGAVAQALESSHRIEDAVWVSTASSATALVCVLVTASLGWFKTAYRGRLGRCACCTNNARKSKRSRRTGARACCAGICCRRSARQRRFPSLAPSIAGGSRAGTSLAGGEGPTTSTLLGTDPYGINDGNDHSDDINSDSRRYREYAEPLTPNTVEDWSEASDAHVAALGSRQQRRAGHQQHDHDGDDDNGYYADNDIIVDGNDNDNDSDAMTALLDAQDAIEGNGDDADEDGIAVARDGDDDDGQHGPSRKGSTLRPLPLITAGTGRAPIAHEGSRMALVLKDVTTTTTTAEAEAAEGAPTATMVPAESAPVMAPTSNKGTASGVRNLDLAIVVAVARDADGALLGLALAVIFSVHNLVMTYWQSILHDVSPDARANGGVFAAAYVCAVVVTASLAFKRVENFLLGGDHTSASSSPQPQSQHSVNRRAILISAVGALCCAASLFGMSRLQSLIGVAVGFIVYHSVAEGCLTILSAQFGRAVLRVGAHVANERRRREQQQQQQQQQAQLMVQQAADGPSPTATVAAGATINNDAASTTSSAKKPQQQHQQQLSPRAHFGTVYGCVTLLAQAVQLAVQLSVGSQGGAHLSEQGTFAVLACIMLALGLVLVGASLYRHDWKRQCRRKAHRPSLAVIN